MIGGCLPQAGAIRPPPGSHFYKPNDWTKKEVCKNKNKTKIANIDKNKDRFTWEAEVYYNNNKLRKAGRLQSATKASVLGAQSAAND